MRPKRRSDVSYYLPPRVDRRGLTYARGPVTLRHRSREGGPIPVDGRPRKFPSQRFGLYCSADVALRDSAGANYTIQLFCCLRCMSVWGGGSLAVTRRICGGVMGRGSPHPAGAVSQNVDRRSRRRHALGGREAPWTV